MRKYTKGSKLKVLGVLSLFSRIRKLKAKNTSCLLLCILCAWSVSSQAATLEPKIGARPMGMSAFAAVADDINAISWNPAGLSLLQKQEATALYSPVYDDMNQSYLAYAYPTGKYGTIGVDLSFLDYGNMDWRDDSGNHLGEFSRSDYSIYASYGIRLIDSLSLGLSLGTTSVSMDPMRGSGTGLGIDLGLLYTVASRASFGLYLENIGDVSASDNEIARQKIRTGAAVSILNRPNMGLVVAMDVDEQQGELDTLYSGAEWSIFGPSSFFVKRKLQQRYVTLLKYDGIADYLEGIPQQVSKANLTIRTGIRKRLAVDESMSFSGGVSIRYLAIPKSLVLKLEHAFMWHPYLETTHRFSLGLEMGRTVYE
ncbi:PorV/PorQ family protein [Candidatus Poribacteria bacterium]